MPRLMHKECGWRGSVERGGGGMSREEWHWEWVCGGARSGGGRSGTGSGNAPGRPPEFARRPQEILSWGSGAWNEE